MHCQLSGLVAATFTPMRPDGSLHLAMVNPIVEHLIHSGVSGLYVCGSTGEGPLMSGDERKATAAAYVEATAGRLPVVVQVGHSSVVESRQLAAHAQQIGADAISAVAPYYFKPDSVGVLVDCLAEIAGGAPDLPFYYYHVPMPDRGDIGHGRSAATCSGQNTHLCRHQVHGPDHRRTTGIDRRREWAF